jgi:hypothetical protein
MLNDANKGILNYNKNWLPSACPSLHGIICNGRLMHELTEMDTIEGV